MLQSMCSLHVGREIGLPVNALKYGDEGSNSSRAGQMLSSGVSAAVWTLETYRRYLSKYILSLAWVDLCSLVSTKNKLAYQELVGLKLFFASASNGLRW